MMLSELEPGQCFRYHGTLYVVIKCRELEADDMVPVLQLDDGGHFYLSGTVFHTTAFFDEEMEPHEYELLEDV